MTAFEDGINALFMDPNMGRDAVYLPYAGAALNIRVIVKQPDAILNPLQSSKIRVATTVFDVRASEVAGFTKDKDKIIYKGATYVVQNAIHPENDPDRLLWQVDTYPEKQFP